MLIEYKGRTVDTKHYSPLTDEQCNELREQYYQKPDMKEVVENIRKVHKGGVVVSKITNYFFKDLMAKVKLHHSKWSIEELFECNDLIRFVHGKTLDNRKVFPETNSDIKNIETALRLGGKGVASKPTNFPMKVADRILRDYNVNNVYYDFSCGWGVRLISSLKHDIEYLGTDPNTLLVDRLNELGGLYNEVNNTNTKFTIKPQGSEIFVEEWENKVGLAFSSPPYFGLEDYKVGEQSYKEGMNYSDWLEGYYKPTIQNIHKYLIQEGYLLININNYDKYDLVGDTISLCEECGFELIGKTELQNLKRIKSTKELTEGKEDIFIFKKE